MRKLKEKIRVNPCPREFCIKVFRRNTTTNLEKNEFERIYTSIQFTYST